MKTYKCEFANGSRVEKIQANSYRNAYDKFLANQGLIQISVIVSSGITDTGEVLRTTSGEGQTKLQTQNGKKCILLRPRMPKHRCPPPTYF